MHSGRIKLGEKGQPKGENGFAGKRCFKLYLRCELEEMSYNRTKVKDVNKPLLRGNAG